MSLILAFLMGQSAGQVEQPVIPTLKDAPVEAQASLSPSQGEVVVPQGTAIQLRLLDRLSTKITQKGETFDLEVIEDVTVGGTIIVPAGTLAVGEVTRSDAKGAFGKSGKLEARILYLKLGGRPLRVSGTLSIAGQGGTTETVLTALAAGTLAFAVTGKSAVLEAGTELFVHTDRPIAVRVSEKQLK